MKAICKLSGDQQCQRKSRIRSRRIRKQASLRRRRKVEQRIQNFIDPKCILEDGTINFVLFRTGWIKPAAVREVQVAAAEVVQVVQARAAIQEVAVAPVRVVHREEAVSSCSGSELSIGGAINFWFRKFRELRFRQFIWFRRQFPVPAEVEVRDHPVQVHRVVVPVKAARVRSSGSAGWQLGFLRRKFGRLIGEVARGSSGSSGSSGGSSDSSGGEPPEPPVDPPCDNECGCELTNSGAQEPAHRAFGFGYRCRGTGSFLPWQRLGFVYD